MGGQDSMWAADLKSWYYIRRRGSIIKAQACEYICKVEANLQGARYENIDVEKLMHVFDRGVAMKKEGGGGI